MHLSTFNSEVRKFLGSVSIFIACLAGADFMLTFLIDQVIKQSDIRYCRMHTEDYEFAVLGNSRGVNSVNEKIFEEDLGLEIVNLSHNSLSPGEILHLSDFLHDSSFVFVEVSTYLWAQEEVEKSAGRFKVFESLRPQSSEIFGVANFNNEIFLRSLYYLFGSDAGWANNGVLDDNRLRVLVGQLSDEDLHIDRIHDLKKLETTLLAKGVRVHFYMAPMRSELRESYRNWEPCLVALQRAFPENFSDLSGLIQAQESFADLMHTNNREVRKIHTALYDCFSESQSQN